METGDSLQVNDRTCQHREQPGKWNPILKNYVLEKGRNKCSMVIFFPCLFRALNLSAFKGEFMKVNCLVLLMDLPHIHFATDLHAQNQSAPTGQRYAIEGLP